MSKGAPYLSFFRSFSLFCMWSSIRVLRFVLCHALHFPSQTTHHHLLFPSPSSPSPLHPHPLLQPCTLSLCSLSVSLRCAVCRWCLRMTTAWCCPWGRRGSSVWSSARVPSAWTSWRGPRCLCPSTPVACWPSSTCAYARTRKCATQTLPTSQPPITPVVYVFLICLGKHKTVLVVFICFVEFFFSFFFFLRLRDRFWGWCLNLVSWIWS